MTSLSVNINAAAYIRNRREHENTPHLTTPTLTELASLSLQAGASGITVHPRPDQRHIRFDDLLPLRSLCSPPFELNVEGFPSQDFLDLVASVKPDQVTLVPDDPSQSTSDHGWPPLFQGKTLTHAINTIHSFGARVSVFSEPLNEDIRFLASHHVDRIELYTGPYATSFSSPQNTHILENLSRATHTAQKLGLSVNAGHDLNLQNLPLLIKTIPTLSEVSIGHALIAHCLIFGIKKATLDFLQALHLP